MRTGLDDPVGRAAGDRSARRAARRVERAPMAAATASDEPCAVRGGRESRHHARRKASCCARAVASGEASGQRAWERADKRNEAVSKRYLRGGVGLTFGLRSFAATQRNALTEPTEPRSRRALGRRDVDVISRLLCQTAAMRSEQSPTRRLHPAPTLFGAADADRLFALAERPDRLGRQVAHAVQVLRDALDKYG